MAISFDSATNDVSGTGTFSHTVGAGTNRFLIVGTYSDSAVSPSAVTYNSAAMTKIVEQASSANPAFVFSLWALANPSLGANNVVVTSTGSGEAIAASYFGVLQTVVPNATTSTDLASGANNNNTLTTTAVDCGHFVYGFSATINWSSVTGGTIRSSSPNAVLLADDFPISPAGSNTITFTRSSAPNFSVTVGAAFEPAPPSTDSGNFLIFM